MAERETRPYSLLGQPVALFDLSVEEWMEDAICSGRPLGAHDTDRLPSPQSTAHRREAERLCKGCPVLGECADYALRTRATDVVMAGVPLGNRNTAHLYAELRTIAGRFKKKR